MIDTINEMSCGSVELKILLWALPILIIFYIIYDNFG